MQIESTYLTALQVTGSSSRGSALSARMRREELWLAGKYITFGDTALLLVMLKHFHTKSPCPNVVLIRIETILGRAKTAIKEGTSETHYAMIPVLPA